MLKAIKIDGEATLLVATAGNDRNVYMSARNIEGVSVSPVADLNALTVLKPRRLLFTKAALDWVKEQAKKDTSDEPKKAKPAKAAEAEKPAKVAKPRAKKA